MNWESLDNRILSLDRLELNLIDVPQKETFHSAVGVRQSRQALIIRWFTVDGEVGVAECSCRPDPYFSHEFLSGVSRLISEIVFPQLENGMTYGAFRKLLARIRGWNFAKAAISEAVHDLWLRQGLSDPITEWREPAVQEIPVGISLGLYESISTLNSRVEAELAKGYRRIKLKIKPGIPVDYLASVRKYFGDIYLSVDANGSFDENSMEELLRYEDLGLAIIEQPFAPDRLDLSARLKQMMPELRICQDESVYEYGHLQSALILSAIDELNLKPGRVGGQEKVIALAELADSHALPIWVGGMFETGIGRTANLRIAARFKEARAHDLSPSTRYFIEDVIGNPPKMNENGAIPLPTTPPQIDEDRLNRFRVNQEVLKKGS